MFQVQVDGKITADLKLKESEKGTKYCQFTIANNDHKKEEPNYVRCTAYGKIAENLVKHKKKGDQLFINGKGRIDTEKKEELLISYFKVTVDEIVYGMNSRPKEETEGII